jgi:hypothetical protein
VLEGGVGTEIFEKIKILVLFNFLKLVTSPWWLQLLWRILQDSVGSETFEKIKILVVSYFQKFVNVISWWVQFFYRVLEDSFEREILEKYKILLSLIAKNVCRNSWWAELLWKLLQDSVGSEIFENKNSQCVLFPKICDEILIDSSLLESSRVEC